MAKSREILIAGLDVGAAKTAALIALCRQGSLRILGAGQSATLGLDKGLITDDRAMAGSIRRAFEEAFVTAGVKTAPVVAGYDRPGVFVRDWPAIPPAGRDAGAAGLTAGGPPRGEKVLCLLHPAQLPLSRRQDGAEARAVAAGAKDVENLVWCVRLAGRVVREIVYTPLASAEVLLTPAEKELGAVLVDIGAGKTSVSYFNRGRLKETAVLPLSSEHIVGDLAVGLRTSMGEARKVLREFGGLSAPGAGGDRRIAAGGLRGGGKEVSPAVVNAIIEARVQELADLLESLFDHFGCSGFLPGGMVLTGGGAQLAGLAGWLEKRLNIAVKTGTVEAGGSPVDEVFFNACGLAGYASGLMPPAEKRGADEWVAGILSRLRSRSGRRREKTGRFFAD
ncbi:MAG: hypothetical protein K6T80_01315 [Firmicutes bacterium]|nr:hypothetical protein [Bacillota bacterium]